jgi:PKD repeat protein
LRLQFGDGRPDVTWTDKNQTQPHTYDTGGSYIATLTVTDSSGNTSSASTTITVTPGPTPPTAQLTATPSTGPPPLVVSFNASGSTAGSAPITSLRLRFGDGSADVTWTDKNQPQSHTYGVMGTYIATLTVTDANNLSSTASRTIQVTGGPVACIQSPLPASGVAIATFHSMGLYYNPPTAPTGDQIFMRYRQGSDDPNAAGAWKQGHPLWYDSRANHAYRGRGSVVHLQPATQYVFEVGIGASYASANWQHHIPGPNGDAVEPCPATWSETFPVGTTLTPWTGTKTTTTSSFYKGARSDSARNHVLLADQSGTPNGYTVYDFTGAAAVAQAPNASGYYPVVISGSYIILKGLKTVGGESGIFIDPGSHDIVIDGCEITSYSRDSGTPLGSGLTGNRGVNEDAGIKFPDSSYGPILDTKRIVIQRSKIHNPAFGNNPWDGGHPFGPAPITMYPTGGQVVIRYNETYSTTNGQLNGPPDLNHFHLDGLVLGGENGQTIGPDVDIYKNLVMHYFDDGVETDGDGINVRVWKNYFDYGGATGISTTPTAVGPAYVWRNVYNRSRTLITQPWGNESDRNAMMKSGGLGGLNGGRRYLYHNTSLQPPYTSESDGVGPYSLGAGNGAGGAGGTGNGMENTVARNNVFEIWKPWWGAYDLTNASGNDLDYDLTNGNLSEAHGLQSTPQYQTNNGWSAYWAGRYRLQAGTPGHDDGIPIPNFNDDYVGAAPDRGAHEDGTPDMIFGTTATGS